MNDLDPGVAYEHVQSAELSRGLFDAGIDLIFVCHVHLDGAGYTAGRLDLFGDGVRCARIHICNCHPDTGHRESPGD